MVTLWCSISTQSKLVYSKPHNSSKLNFKNCFQIVEQDLFHSDDKITARLKVGDCEDITDISRRSENAHHQHPPFFSEEHLKVHTLSWQFIEST